MKQPTQWNADGELYDHDISEFPWKKGRLYRDVSKARFTENFPCKFAPVVVRGLDLLDGTPVLDIKPYVRNSAASRVSLWWTQGRSTHKLTPKNLPERWKIFGEFWGKNPQLFVRPQV